MDRRGFLALLGSAVAGIALEQAIPLGRVWSFPKKIVIAKTETELAYARLIGDTIRIRLPQRYVICE